MVAGAASGESAKAGARVGGKGGGGGRGKVKEGKEEGVEAGEGQDGVVASGKAPRAKKQRTLMDVGVKVQGSKRS